MKVATGGAAPNGLSFSRLPHRKAAHEMTVWAWVVCGWTACGRIKEFSSLSECVEERAGEDWVGVRTTIFSDAVCHDDFEVFDLACSFTGSRTRHSPADWRETFEVDTDSSFASLLSKLSLSTSSMKTIFPFSRGEHANVVVCSSAISQTRRPNFAAALLNTVSSWSLLSDTSKSAAMLTRTELAGLC